MLISRCATIAAICLSLCAGSLFSRIAYAGPNFPAESRTIPYSGALPPCEDWDALRHITDSFNYSRFWYSNAQLELQRFEAVREIGFRTNGREFVPRRYCIGRAMFSDGREREVKYNLIEGGGFVGLGNGVEWCVVGQDPFHVFSPACRAAGP